MIEITNEIIPPNLNIASLLSEVVFEVIRSEHALWKSFERYEIKRKLALEFGENYKIKFDKVSIAKNILKVFNSMQK